jgi:hypothetical protein
MASCGSPARWRSRSRVRSMDASTFDRSTLPQPFVTAAAGAARGRRGARANVKSVCDQGVAYPASRTISGWGVATGLEYPRTLRGAITGVAVMETSQLETPARRFGRQPDACSKISAPVALLRSGIGDDTRRFASLSQTPDRRHTALPTVLEEYRSGMLRKCADQIGSIATRAVAHSGGKA